MTASDVEKQWGFGLAEYLGPSSIRRYGVEKSLGCSDQEAEDMVDERMPGWLRGV